jgi:mannosylglycoprotein endo-beta-mannosidase
VSDELSKLETLEEIRTLSEHQVQKKMSLIRETLVLLDQEEDYWMTRCHEQWLMQGDNNTSYFHRIANGRRRKAKIISLEKEGVVIEGDNNLLKHATEYYTDLFVPEDDHEVQIDSNIWAEQPQVSGEENVELSKPFSEEEIKMLCFKWKLIRLRGQIRYLLTCIKLVGL